MTPMTLSFDDKLARYADLLVRTGVNLPQGGKLLVQAPIEAAPLVRLVTRAAYRAGALDVRVNYNDAHLGLALFEDGSDEAVDFLPDWHAAQREARLQGEVAALREQVYELSEKTGQLRGMLEVVCEENERRMHEIERERAKYQKLRSDLIELLISSNP